MRSGLLSEEQPIIRAMDPNKKTIPIAEIFGPTIQGEGLLAGRPTYFLRVGGCDFSCRWCDTDHAVDPAKVRKLERVAQPEILARLIDHAAAHPGPDWLAISGGNPGLYDLGEVVSGWQRSKSRRKVTVETQGTKYQQWFDNVDVLTISPKPPSSGMTNLDIDAFLVEADWGTGQYILKCICFDDADYDFARELHLAHPDVKFYLSTGTAMGGLSGRWVPPAIPDLLNDGYDVDRYAYLRGPLDGGFGVYPESRPNPGAVPEWTPSAYVDTKEHLLRRYKWLVEKMMNDPAMSDVAVFPQIHALVWGITTRGV